MEIFHLKCFVTLAEYLSFSNAAYALYIEPSTLSKTIAKLEQEMHVHLFERTNRKVRLTPAGTVFLKEAKEIVELYERSLLKVEAAAIGSMGYLNVCYCGDIEHYILPQSIRAFRAGRPAVNVQLYRYSWRQIANAANFKQMDLGITLSFGLQNFSHFCSEVICLDPFVAVLPYDHPLAGRESICISDLQNERFAFANLEMSLGAFYHSLDCIFPKVFRPKILSQDSSKEEITTKIAAGFGVGIVTSLAIQNDPLLAYVPLTDVSPAQLIAMWPPENKNPLLPPFIETLREESRRIPSLLPDA